MSEDHFKVLSNIEKTYLDVTDQEVRDKEKLENELDKMMEFKFATMRVDDFAQDCSDLIVAVIEKIKVEIESKSYNIKKFNKDVKDRVLGYFGLYLRDVELSEELKDMASEYGYVQEENKPESKLVKYPDHLNDLLQFEQKHADEIKKFEDIQRKLQTKKDNLLECRAELVTVNCTEFDSEIAKIDVDICDFDTVIRRIGEEIYTLQDLISADMMEYTNQFMFSSSMTPEIVELLRKYGINTFTLAKNSIINDSQTSANFDGLVETECIDPKKDEEDVQDVDGELEDSSKDNNNNEA